MGLSFNTHLKILSKKRKIDCWEDLGIRVEYRIFKKE
jgi:hypothetical protein